MNLFFHKDKKNSIVSTLDESSQKKYLFVTSTLKKCSPNIEKKNQKKSPLEKSFESDLVDILKMIGLSDSNCSDRSEESSNFYPETNIHRSIHNVKKNPVYQEFPLNENRLFKQLNIDYPIKKPGKEKAKLKISSLVDKETGYTFYISQTIANGSTGKMRLGIDHKGRFWAFKEFRLDPKEFAAKKNSKEKNDGIFHTQFSTINSIRNELKVGRLIDSHVMIRKLYNDNGKIYALMHYMDGGNIGNLCLQLDWDSVNNVSQTVKSRESLSWLFLEQAGIELNALHKNNLIHCDIKPGNILFNKDGKITLTDFDASVRTNNQGYARKGGYTNGYRAPERLNSSSYNYFSSSADIWSLGVTVFDFWSSSLSSHSKDYESAFKNPFHATDAKKSEDTLNVYAIYRKRRIENDKNMSLLISLLKPEEITIYHNFVLSFQFIKKHSPELESFLFNNILVPHPNERASALTISDTARRNLGSKQRENAKNYLYKVATFQAERMRLITDTLSLAAQQVPLDL